MTVINGYMYNSVMELLLMDSIKFVSGLKRGAHAGGVSWRGVFLVRQVSVIILLIIFILYLTVGYGCLYNGD